MKILVKCAKCKSPVLTHVHGKVKLRARITVFFDDKCAAVCSGCGNEVSVPVSVSVPIQNDQKEPKFVVRRTT